MKGHVYSHPRNHIKYGCTRVACTTFFILGMKGLCLQSHKGLNMCCMIHPFFLRNWPFCSDSPEWRSRHMVMWFGRHGDTFGTTENAFFSCIYNPQITVSPTSSFSASFNGNRVKNHPSPWTCPLSPQRPSGLLGTGSTACHGHFIFYTAPELCRTLW